MESDQSAHVVCDEKRRTNWLVIVVMVALADVLIYRTQGYAGPALFFPLCTGLLLAGHRKATRSSCLWLLIAMLLALAFSMLWLGSFSQVLAAFWLTGAVAMSAQGAVPYLLESLVYLAGLVPGGYDFFRGIQLGWRRQVLGPLDRRIPSESSQGASATYILPTVSVGVFGLLFLLANPDLVREVSTLFADVLNHLQSLLMRLSPVELIVWCTTIWLTGGLLKPLTRPIVDTVDALITDVGPNFRHPLFPAFRNTLVSLIVLFAVYLVFEFRTLWFRTFPEGFYYSGYAHQGAAWLTVALALATLTLSLMFRGTMLSDERLSSLKRCAWIWSALNLLLASSVYNRLLIYVSFNGMTRMRVVGFLGITAAVGGFLLVLWKINRQHNFVWLIRRQLWVLAFAVYLLLIMPTDRLVHRYNVARILDGSPAPSVQISEHPINDDALPVLLPLLDSDDAFIREGVQALLWSRYQKLQSDYGNSDLHWTAIQLGPERALQQLESAKNSLSSVGSSASISQARQRFHDYSMQWW